MRSTLPSAAGAPTWWLDLRVRQLRVDHNDLTGPVKYFTGPVRSLWSSCADALGFGQDGPDHVGQLSERIGAQFDRHARIQALGRVDEIDVERVLNGRMKQVVERHIRAA